MKNTEHHGSRMYSIDADESLRSEFASKSTRPLLRTNVFLAMMAIVTAAFLCATTSVLAVVSTYSSEASWQSAVSGSTLIDFDDLAPDTNLSNQYSGVTFSPINTGIPRASDLYSAYSGSNLVITYPDLTNVMNGGGDVRIAFDSPQGGVSFWHADSEYINSVTLYDALDQVLGTYNLQVPHPLEWAFLGFASSSNDISKVDISIDTNDFVGLDNLRFGATTTSQSVLVSNLNEPLRGATPIGNNPNPVDPGEPWNWAAQSFQSDNQQYSLASIDAVVGNGSTAPLPDVVAELRADDAGTIGALIATFTAPDVSEPASALTFLPNGAVTLEANTQYWFVLGSSNPGDGTYFWQYAEGNAFTGPGSLSGFADTPDSGVNWIYGSDNPYFLQVNVNPAGSIEWNVDAFGDWTEATNWSTLQAPSTNSDTAVFGGVITTARTVVVDSAVTVKGIVFDNANTYAVAGTGSVNLEAGVGDAGISVAQGTHEFQARVNLLSDTDADIATGATLEFNNRLSLGGNTLTKTGDGAMQINNDLNTGGGSVVVLGGSLGGGGTVGGNVMNTSGAVAPGNSAGQLTVEGDYTQGSTGLLAIELGGLILGTEYDHLQVTGNAALDGTLNVSLIEEFTPSAGDSFDILDWGTIGGTFAAMNLPTVAGLAWDTSLLYTTGELSLAAAGLTGDYNQNDIVDAADYTVWRDTLGSTTNLTADGDNSSLIDAGDRTVWQANFGRALGSGANEAAAVPEPATFALLMMAGAIAFCIAWYRKRLPCAGTFWNSNP